VRPVGVGALPEVDHDAGGELGGVERAEDFVGLPRVHGHPDVVPGRLRGELFAQFTEFGGQQRVPAQLVDAAELGVLRVDGEPAQPDVRAGLRCVPGPVARGEPDAALVEHEPRVAGEVPVGDVVVHRGQFGRGRRAPQPGGLVGDRRSQLGEHVGQPQPAQPQDLPGVHDEGPRVGDRFAGPARAARFDRPAVERAPPGPEGVGGTGQLQPVPVAVGDRFQQVLVGQFAEHLVRDQGAGRPPGGCIVQGHRSSRPNVVNAVRSGSSCTVLPHTALRITAARHAPRPRSGAPGPCVCRSAFCTNSDPGTSSATR
jgi:hypothetical protein